MSEKQLMKAEELLDLIASPGSRSQEEASSENKKEWGSNDSSYVEEIASKDSVSIVSHPCESEAVSSESDIIASHAFLEEPDTYYCNSASDLDSHTASSESDLTGHCNADIHTGSGVGQEPNTKYHGNTDENLEFSKMSTDVKTAGLDSEFDATRIQGSEFFESELKPTAEESDTKSNMNVNLFELEEEHKILETESSYNECGMETSEGLFKQQVNEAQAELQIYSQTGMEVEVNIDEVNPTQKETETEYFTDDTKLDMMESEGKYGELSPESGSHAVGMKTSIASQNVQLNQEAVPQGSVFEDVNLELKSCKEELELTKKLLARSERQLEKANSYNEDLRRQVETLSAEIHHYRHRTMVDVDIQVDKDELINYASGEMVLPDWGTTFQGSTRSAEAEADDTSAQAVSTEKLSIAESLKATAEAVVLEQSGFVYDQNSGLYYDYNSGYYYDNEKSLYYDPNSGTYFYYDHETNEYQFHSQVDVTCYQWQHQSGASDGQPGAAGSTTQTVQSMSGQAALASSQQKIVPKENLRKTEKRRKKEKKKEKEKDEKVFKNRKERRKALQERIEQKRQKKEKKDKKHHRHKKRKKKDDKKERKNGEENKEKYVEDKMRKRLKKKKKKHKREKEKKGVTDNVIEIKEDSIQYEHTKESQDIIHIDNDETKDIKSKTEICDIGKKADTVLDHSDVKHDSHVPVSHSMECNTVQVTQNENVENKPDREEHMEYDNDNDNDEVNGTDVSDSSLETKEVEDTIVSRDSSSKSEEKGETVVENIEPELTVEGKEHEGNETFQQHSNGKDNHEILEDKNLGELLPVSGDNMDITNNSETVLTTEEKHIDVLDVEIIDSEQDTRSGSDDKHIAVTDDSILISSDSDSDSEMESGEISESEASQSESDSLSYHSTDSRPDSDSSSSASEEEDFSQQNELAGGWPPCIRVMVTESCCLEVGTLFIVTCTGGTVGREKDMNHTIRIPDINVSKMHAEIKYNSRRGQYEIFDRGSQNGTYINDLRIAEGKDSKTCGPINHGDVLQLGDNKLLCHIHTGSDTCDKCEPGIVKANYFANQPKERITILSKEEKKLQQKQQLKEIKKKYGLKNAAYVDNTKAINNPQYTDKASERRKTVGSDGPEVKKQTPASVHRPISSENIGHKLLKKMGWSEGESLGKENTGIQEPVTVTLRANQTAGLGSSSSALFSPDDANSIDVRKAARRVQAQQRFSKLQSDTAGNQTDKSKTTKQWTKGETQYAEGGNS